MIRLHCGLAEGRGEERGLFSLLCLSQNYLWYLRKKVGSIHYILEIGHFDGLTLNISVGLSITSHAKYEIVS